MKSRVWCCYKDSTDTCTHERSSPTLWRNIVLAAAILLFENSDRLQCLLFGVLRKLSQSSKTEIVQGLDTSWRPFPSLGISRGSYIVHTRTRYSSYYIVRVVLLFNSGYTIVHRTNINLCKFKILHYTRKEKYYRLWFQLGLAICW